MAAILESDSLNDLSSAVDVDGYVASSESDNEELSPPGSELAPAGKKNGGSPNGDAIAARVKHHIKRPPRFVNNNHLPNGTSGTESSSPTEASMRKFMKNSRKSRTRFGRGNAKKGGAGGKGVWGSIVDDYSADAETMDPNDPNYDSDNLDLCKLEAITPELDDAEIEVYVKSIVSEYFEHADSEEAINSLMELAVPRSKVHMMMVIAIVLAIDRKAFNREMTSVLISDMYGRMLQHDDFARAFDILLDSLDDLMLDCPTADNMIGNFIARAVADDCLAPVYVEKTQQRCRVKPAKTAIDHAANLLSTKHRIFQIDQIWGLTGGIRPVKYLVRQIHSILEEFVSSNETIEAGSCLQALEVPHFHHEFVYEAIVKAIEDSKEPVIVKICGLLKYLFEAGIITQDQLKNGFLRVFEEMPDIVIDVPYAYDHLENIKAKSEKLAFFPAELEKEMPQRARKRFVSEGDGGLIKT